MRLLPAACVGLILATGVSLHGHAGVQRTVSGAEQGTSYEQRMIDKVRDAVDALRDTLAEQSPQLQEKMRPLLRKVNGEAEQYVGSIKAYIVARDDYYNNFKGRDNDANTQARRELYEAGRTMRVEERDYYEATADYLQAYSKARREERLKSSG